MADAKDIVQAMATAKAEYSAAIARGSGVAVAKERMKNIAFNYYDQLQNAMLENISLREEVEALDTALADADQELKELREKKKPKDSTAKEVPKE